MTCKMPADFGFTRGVGGRGSEKSYEQTPKQKWFVLVTSQSFGITLGLAGELGGSCNVDSLACN